jgi:putative heme-binding domain-containing protein
LTDGLPIDSVYSRRVGPDVNPPSDLLASLASMARDDRSGLVRLVLASTLQRVPVSQRPALAEPLLGHEEDVTDANLPALIWTGLIPLAEADPDALVSLMGRGRIPVVLRLTARRLGEDVESRPGPIDALLRITTKRPRAFQEAVLAGLLDALTGWRKAAPPGSWKAFRESIDPELAERARPLDVLFGDGRALEEVRRLALDEGAPIESRRDALATLIDARPSDLREVCERLIRTRFLNAIAARGLTLIDDPEVGIKLARSYRSFHPSERPAALEAMTSRSSFAMALLDEVAAGRIPRGDLTAFHIRQIRSLADPAIDRRLAEAWGEQRDTPAERRQRIESLKQHLDEKTLAQADPGRGRLVFERTCASCHRLHGRGGEVGPDLTGAGRDNLDYLLENLVDPGASVSADFRMSVVALQDGRVLNGLIRARTERTLTLQTQTEALVIERSEIDEERPTSQSLMPDGLLDTIPADEIRDLISYLMHRTQVPLKENTAGDGP